MQAAVRAPWPKYSRYALSAFCLCLATWEIKEIYLNFHLEALVERITDPPANQNNRDSTEYLALKIISNGGRNRLLKRFAQIIESPESYSRMRACELLFTLELTNPEIRNSLLKVANDESKDPEERRDAILALRYIDPVIDDFCNSVEELKPKK